MTRAGSDGLSAVAAKRRRWVRRSEGPRVRGCEGPKVDEGVDVGRWRLLIVTVWFGLVVLMGVSGCSNAPASAAREAATPVRPTVQLSPADLSAAIGQRLSSASVLELGTIARAEHDLLVSLYGTDPGVLWAASTGKPTENAKAALGLLEGAAGEGLDPAEYGAAGLRRLAGNLDAAEAPAVGDVAGFDVALSAAVLRYFRHLHSGRVDPATMGLRLHVPADPHDLAVIVRSAIDAGRVPEAAAALVPPFVQYRQLRDALARYRSLAAQTDVPAAPAFARPLHPGEPAAADALRAIAGRLRALGDLGGDIAPVDPAVYDGPLVEGVQRFQARHGLDPDGVIGRGTEAALAVPISWRVRQIELALERFRWLPDLTKERIIGLNIPMFHLWGWDEARPGGVPAIDMRAIVGRAIRTETPVFVEEMREVIFRPYWNVPRSILLNEILPAVARDPDYLRRQEMEIVRGPGDDARPVPATDENLALLRQGTLRLRQRPGSRNALGLVKFVFPNSENVYLHSTPAQELFSRARRDFSHGCVRVEDPVSLAEWVLSGQAEWTRDRIVAAMSGSGPSRVALERPIQVVLFYVTAAVVPDGTLHFADDIYRQDGTLDRALAKLVPR